MLNRDLKLITTLVLSLTSPMLLAGVSDDVRALVEQGKSWQSLGKRKQAAEVWKKLLLIDPNNVEAIYGLGMIDVEDQKLSSAQTYLDKLNKLAPNSKLSLSLAQDMRLNSGNNAAVLEQARHYAQHNEAEKAVARFRTLFNGKTPQGRIGLEYYQALRTLPDGWDEAKDGLERLYKESPSDAWVAIIYAQTLTWKVPTRREGIRMLEALSERSDVRGVAMDSWKNALTLPGPAPAKEDMQFIRNYLAKNPDDAEIKKLLANGGRTIPVTPAAPVDPEVAAVQDATTLGMKALANDEDAAAEAQFNKILATKANDSDALGGLGVIRMRQGRHQEARTLLTKAAKQNSAKWSEALASVSYWAEIKDAQEAKRAGNVAKARSLLEHASKSQPSKVEASIALAELSLENGQLADAEQRYARIFNAHPDSIAAVGGILSVLMQTNRQQEAGQLMANLPTSITSQPEAVQALRKRYAESLAKSASAPNLSAEDAQLRLEEALRYTPDSTWMRLNLAYQYQNAGRKPEARALVEGLLAQEPNNADALYAHGLMAADVKRWDIAMNDIQRIPDARRTPEALALYRRAWLSSQIDRANAMAQQSQQTQAIGVLRQLEPYAQQDPEMLLTLSYAYMDAKENQRAMDLVRGYLARTRNGSVPALLQYANLLSKLNQDGEVAAIIQDLQRRNLSVEQRKSVEDLQVGMSIRRAESLRQYGDLAAAYDALAPALNYKPNDPGVIGALARMYGAANDYQSSLALYQRLISQSPSNGSLYISAAQMAIQAKDTAYAEQMVDEALRVEPDNATIYTEAGRIYKTLGKTAKAKEVFTAAVRLNHQPFRRQDPNMPQTRPAASNNPFIGMSLQRPANAEHSGTIQTNYPVSNAQSFQLQKVALNEYSGQAQQQLNTYPAPPVYNPNDVQQPINDSGWQANGAAPVNPPVYRYQEYAQPYQGYTQSNQGYAQPYQGYAQPYQGYAQPNQGYAQPNQGYAPGAYPPVPYPVQNVVPTPMYEPVTMQSPATNTYRNVKKVARKSTPKNTPTTVIRARPTKQRSSQSYAVYPPGYSSPQRQPYYTPNAQQPFVYPLPQAAQPVYPYAPAAQSGVLGSPSAFPLAANRLDRQTPKVLGPQEELAKLMEEDSVQFKAGVVVRNRTGESGLGKLTDIQTPIEAIIPAGEGKIIAQVTPVMLDAGKISGSYDANSRFGGGPTATGTTLSSPNTVSRNQDASGVGMSIGYRNNGFEANVGTTPLGFQNNNMIGNIKFSGSFDSNPSTSYSLDINRKPVTDSVLSFAGTKDPRTGDSWGSVVATGGRAQVGLDYRDFGIYAYGSWHELSGKNVADNTRATFGGGAYFNMIDQPDSKLVSGVNLGGMFFDNNQYAFTYGNGGYFSPQRYFAVTVPLTYAKRSNKLSLLFGGQLGVQTFKQDDAEYFPTDSARQQQAITTLLTANPTVSNPGIYSGQSNTGLNFGLNGQADYQFAPNLFLGGLMSLNNAGNFHEYNFGLYLRYSMVPVKSNPELPVGTYLSPYAITF